MCAFCPLWNPNETETTDQYATRLHQLASSCTLCTLAGKLIKDLIVLGTKDNESRAVTCDMERWNSIVLLKSTSSVNK